MQEWAQLYSVTGGTALRPWRCWGPRPRWPGGCCRGSQPASRRTSGSAKSCLIVQGRGSMFTAAANIYILIAALALSMAFMVGLNRIWPVSRRYTSNDQIGWQLSVLGTTYAVILGFMLYTELT